VTHGNLAYGETRMGTIGVPWPDTGAKIMDADTGEKEMTVGEVGELCIRGPQVMRGYWNMPTETANTLRIHSEGGDPWLHVPRFVEFREELPKTLVGKILRRELVAEEIKRQESLETRSI